jgi:hypothetical protein
MTGTPVLDVVVVVVCATAVGGVIAATMKALAMSVARSVLRGCRRVRFMGYL